MDLEKCECCGKYCDNNSDNCFVKKFICNKCEKIICYDCRAIFVRWNYDFCEKCAYIYTKESNELSNKEKYTSYMFRILCNKKCCLNLIDQHKLRQDFLVLRKDPDVIKYDPIGLKFG